MRVIQMRLYVFLATASLALACVSEDDATLGHQAFSIGLAVA